MALAVRNSELIPTSHPHIVRREGVCGGRPHIQGTRISVRTIAELFRRGQPAAEIAAEFPHVDPSSIYDAISFYLDHKAEIEAEIEANSLAAALERTDAELGEDGVIRFRDGSG
jgi:uncharacterized protein (DUF433 family)